MYVGRFAPSPTGPLHFGSLVAALASWLDARAARGRWLLRMEDLDTPRNQPGAADDILRTLERLGLTWDGPVVYQSRRTALYRAALERLEKFTYWCGCTRREIADSSLGLAADGAQIYPGTCRGGIAPGKVQRAIRVRTTSE
ncbi:MAG TPA: glutamate--tRNA ligase family protein, partial [Burkholderiales bacterium]|nr:glutamate--tRNA ligase family protein [Burkholderiales bacterium]